MVGLLSRLLMTVFDDVVGVEERDELHSKVYRIRQLLMTLLHALR